MENEPWAKFRTRSTPKISERPEAMRKRNIAAVSPLSDCASRNERSGMDSGGDRRPPPSGRLVHEARRIDVRGRLHHGEADRGVQRHLAVELTTVGLMVLLPERLPADRRVDGEAEQGLRHLLAVGAAGLLDRLDQELHAGVALDRP